MLTNSLRLCCSTRLFLTSVYQRRMVYGTEYRAPRAVFDDDGKKINFDKLSQLKHQIELSSKDTSKKKPPLSKDNRDVQVKKTDEYDNEDDVNFKPPQHYIKVNGWDKNNRDLKTLRKVLSSRQEREKSDTVVLEGVRVIQDAVSAGFVPRLVVFSRVSLLQDLGLDKNKETRLYHVPYNNIKMWSDMVTSPGVMAAFSKSEIESGVAAASPLRLTLVCDNIRTPDNLGSVFRCAAAAGARKIVTTRNCVDMWNPKVIRAAAGAHFHVPIVQRVTWDVMDRFLPDYPQVVLADMAQEGEAGMEDAVKQRLLDQLEEEASQDGFCAQLDGQEEDGEAAQEQGDVSYLDEEFCNKYKEIPLQTTAYSDFKLRPGVATEAVVVVGGETEGVSGAAYKFCHANLGEKIHIPLRNNVNSLNVISATSVILFRLQQELLKLSKS